MATIDKYTLSSTLNDEDLFLVAKYDSSTAQYVDYNKTNSYTHLTMPTIYSV